jgi:hypothetical protein
MSLFREVVFVLFGQAIELGVAILITYFLFPSSKVNMISLYGNKGKMTYIGESKVSIKEGIRKFGGFSLVKID